MNKQTFFSIGLIVALIFTLFSLKNDSVQSQEMKLFQQWASNYNKQYEDQTQKIYRFQVFLSTLKKIQEHNKKYINGQESYQMGLNQFSDLLDSEFEAKYFNQNQFDRKLADSICTGPQPPIPDKFEDAWDWTAKGAVTSVRNQGSNCKGGYAIATIQAIEGYMFIKQSKLISLSAQQIIDCSTGNGNTGCNGGDPVKSFQYLIKNGITKQQTYSYQGHNQSCTYQPKSKIWDINHCVIINANNATLIKAGVRKQPVITTLKINLAALKSYKSGVFKSKDCGSSNLQSYSVLIVGWGVAQQGSWPNKKTYNYWKIKTSLGSDFGLHGYFQLQNPGDNGACGAHANVVCPY